MMRRFVSSSRYALTLVALMLSTPLIAQEAQEAQEAQPEVVIKEMRVELGEVFQEKSFKHTFKVLNTGKANLEIKGVKPG